MPPHPHATRTRRSRATQGTDQSYTADNPPVLDCCSTHLAGGGSAADPMGKLYRAVSLTSAKSTYMLPAGVGLQTGYIGLQPGCLLGTVGPRAKSIGTLPGWTAGGRIGGFQWLARAFEAVAGRPMGRPLPLGVPSRPEPSGAP